MKFLRGHGHFLLKQLYKHIVLANDESLSPEEYNNLSNTTYTNDESWQQIANDFQFAYDYLPDTQADKGRPTKAAAAAYLAKTYLYKAYRQDDPDNNEVTSINAEDLAKVVQYTENQSCRPEVTVWNRIFIITSVRNLSMKTDANLCGLCSIP